MTFLEWLAQTIGTDAWVVAPRLTPRLGEKYQIAIPQKRFTELRAEYARRLPKA